MKKYAHPELEIKQLTADVITDSDPSIVDKGYDLPIVPADTDTY